MEKAKIMCKDYLIFCKHGHLLEYNGYSNQKFDLCVFLCYIPMIYVKVSLLPLNI